MAGRAVLVSGRDDLLKVAQEYECLADATHVSRF
jgi:hypothetical protein